MPGKYAADFINRFYQRISELLILKMRPHFLHNFAPKFAAALFMDRVVPYDSKFANTRRDKNEYGVALTRLLHIEPMKLLLRSNQRIMF